MFSFNGINLFSFLNYLAFGDEGGYAFDIFLVVIFPVINHLRLSFVVDKPYLHFNSNYNSYTIIKPKQKPTPKISNVKRK